MTRHNTQQFTLGFALLAAAITPTIAGAQGQPASAQRALSLDDAIRAAEQNSETINIANAGVLRARGQQVSARSAYFPQLNGTVNYQRTLQSQFAEISKKASGGSGGGTDTSGGGGDLASSPIARIFASENTIIFGVTGNQTLYSGGRVGAQNRAAAAGARSASIGLTAAQAELRLNVASAYYDATLADRMVQIAESSLVQSERTFRQTSLARQVGNVAEFDLLRARVARDNLRPQVIGTRAQRDIAYLRLRQIVNVPLNQPLRLTSDIQQGLPTAPAAERLAENSGARISPVARITDNVESVLEMDRAVSTSVNAVVASTDTTAAARSTVRQAQENVVAQEQLLRIAKGARLPSLGLTTTYQRFNYPLTFGDLTPGNTFPNWTVGLGLSVPLFSGGRIRGDQMMAQANLAEAKQRHEQTKDFAALDARLAIADLEQQETAFLASVGTDEVASRAYKIAEVRYTEGISTQIELSESRILLNQAAANRALAARNLQVARVKLALLKDLPLGAGQTQGPVPQSQGQPQSQETRSQGQSAPQSGAGTRQTQGQ